MTRAPLWLCAALALSGCGAPSLQPLSASALKDWDELASYTDEQALAAAEADGRLAKHRVGRGELGRRSLDLITVEGLTDGAVQDLAVYCDVVRVDAEAERKPIAFLATLRDPATANSGGLTRGKLLLVVPERQLTGYTCDQAGTYLFYLRLPDGSAGLYAIARAAEGEAIDDFVEGQRWSSVVKRLERAVATGAALEQIRDEIACVEAIPFPEDRAAAEPLLETYVRELAQRADTIEAAWSGASLARRVVLTREAVDLAGAAAILPTRRFAQLAERLRPEVDAQLAEAAARAERERRGFSRAGWTLCRRDVAGEAARGALEPTARAALAPRVLSLVPALEGPANPSLDALYAGTALGLPSLLARVGAAPVDRRAFLAAATAPPARLSVGPLQETLSAREERSQRVHAYTRPNPQHSRWLAAVQEVESRLAGAQAGVKANENYMRNESYYDKVLDGYTERRDRINGENVIVREPRYKTVTKTRLVHDSAMEQRYRQAQAAAEALSARLRELHAQEPPARLPAEAVIEEQRQVWSGEAQRTLSLSVDGASLSEAQRFPAPAYRVRSAGFQGSDLPEENLPAEDSWTTREALLTQAREQFAAELGDALRPHLLRALEARLAEHLAALGAGADEERRWARVLLGLPLDAAEASPLRAALALDPS